MRQELTRPINGFAVIYEGRTTITVAILHGNKEALLACWRQACVWPRRNEAKSVSNYLAVHKTSAAQPWLEFGRHWYDWQGKRHIEPHAGVQARIAWGGMNRGALAKAVENAFAIEVLFTGLWDRDELDIERCIIEERLTPEPPTTPINLRTINIFNRPYRI